MARSGQWASDGEGESLEGLRALPPPVPVPAPLPADDFERAARELTSLAVELAGGDRREADILLLRSHVLLARGYARSEGGGVTARTLAHDRPACRVHR